MKSYELEDYINKKQNLWTRMDIEKLESRFGRKMYYAEGINNKLFLLFKYRDMAMKDQIILDFVTGKSNDYLYIINYVKEYIDTIEFIFWPSELALHIIYKILCEKIMSDSDLQKDSTEYEGLRSISRKMAMIKYTTIKQESSNNHKDKNREETNENK